VQPSLPTVGSHRVPELLRYYLDEHLPAAVALGLRARGIDVVSTAEAGRAAQEISDADQLAYATAQSWVLVTRDSDFIHLASTQLPHAGIIYLQRVLSIGDTIAYLEVIARLSTADEVRDILTCCDR